MSNCKECGEDLYLILGEVETLCGYCAGYADGRKTIGLVEDFPVAVAAVVKDLCKASALKAIASSITVVTGRSGLDRVSVHTTLPSPYEDPALTDGLYLNFEVANGKGVHYIQNHFPGIPIRLIDATDGQITHYPAEVSK